MKTPVSPSKHEVVSDEDQLEKLMKPTGCLELHYKVQVRQIFQPH